jgi:hypothetical protein
MKILTKLSLFFTLILILIAGYVLSVALRYKKPVRPDPINYSPRYEIPNPLPPTWTDDYGKG